VVNHQRADADCRGLRAELARKLHGHGYRSQAPFRAHRSHLSRCDRAHARCWQRRWQRRNRLLNSRSRRSRLGGDPALHIRSQLVDMTLIGDLQSGHTDVENQNAGQQCHQRCVPRGKSISQCRNRLRMPLRWCAAVVERNRDWRPITPLPASTRTRPHVGSRSWNNRPDITYREPSHEFK